MAQSNGARGGAPGPRGEDIQVDVLDDGWDETAEPLTTSGTHSVVPRIHETAPPPEEELTQLGDLTALARVMDFDAVPRRARVEMVALPLPQAAPLVLARVDGRTSIRQILADCRLSEDEGVRVLHMLLQVGMIAV
jgi:hypothetical protein